MRVETEKHWASHIGSGWRMLRVGDQVDLTNGFPYDSQHFNNEHVGKPLVRIRDILGEGLPTYFSGNDGLQVVIRDGDIAIGMDGDFNAKLWSKGEALLNQRVCAIKPKETAEIDFHYLAYCLPNGLKILNDLTHSTTVKHLASRDILSLRIPAPDSATQRSIVSYLDHETRRIDDLAAQKKIFIDLLREKRVAAIFNAVTKGIDRNTPMKPSGQDWLGDVPSHWNILAAARLFDERDERSRTGDEELLTVSHLTGVTPRSAKTVHMIQAESTIGYKQCHPGDLVVNTLWAWMGAMGTAPMFGIVSPAYNAYTPRRDLLDPRYVDYIVRLPLFAKEVTRFSKGVWSSRLRLYPEGFREVRWPAPPLEEQAKIADRLNRETTRIDGLIRETERSIDLLKEKRAALITAAVTGKIDVRSAA